MQIALSLGLGGQAAPEVTTGPVIDPPMITRLVVDLQTPEGDLPLVLDVSEECLVHFVLTTSAQAPGQGQIAAQTDHTGAPAASSGTLTTSDWASYTAPLAVAMPSGNYHLHAYPADHGGNGNVVSFGPIAYADSFAE